jgi:hypothetical protein
MTEQEYDDIVARVDGYVSRDDLEWYFMRLEQQYGRLTARQRLQAAYALARKEPEIIAQAVQDLELEDDEGIDEGLAA